MAVHVFVPSLLRPLCDGAREIDVGPGPFGQIVAELDSRCPGFADRIIDGRSLRPDLAVAVNGEMISPGLHELIPDEAELAIVPALGGG